jgi:hypothetical protein
VTFDPNASVAELTLKEYDRSSGETCGSFPLEQRLESSMMREKTDN